MCIFTINQSLDFSACHSVCQTVTVDLRAVSLVPMVTGIMACTDIFFFNFFFCFTIDTYNVYGIRGVLGEGHRGQVHPPKYFNRGIEKSPMYCGKPDFSREHILHLCLVHCTSQL